MVFYFLTIISPVSAQNRANVGSAQGFLDQTVDRTGLEKTDLATGTGQLIERILQFSGFAFFLLMVYAGFMWMTAQGNEDRVTKARDTLIAAGIGIFIIVGSYALTNFIVTRLAASSQGTDTGPGGGNLGNETLGCCFDKTDESVIAGDIWAWRIATEADCQAGGTNQNDPNDEFFGPGDWRFTPDMNAAECMEAYEQL